MDRSDAATALFRWQLEGQQDLVRAAGADGDRSLLSIVESVAPPEPARRPRSPAPAPLDFLRLEEEREVDRLRHRLRALLPYLTPDERETLEADLRPDLVPKARIDRVRAEVERLGGRQFRRVLQTDFESRLVRPQEPRRTPSQPAPAASAPPDSLRALLLFSRTGRLLAGEGETSPIDLGALSQLVARGDPGNTWSLAHRAGSVVGHIGERAALVAVFARRPKPSVGGTLRVSVQSLEQRERLVKALSLPGSHEPLMAYLRAVRVLLRKTV